MMAEGKEVGEQLGATVNRAQRYIAYEKAMDRLEDAWHDIKHAKDVKEREVHHEYHEAREGLRELYRAALEQGQGGP